MPGRIAAGVRLRPEDVRNLAIAMGTIALTSGAGAAALGNGGVRGLAMYLSNEGTSHATGLPVGWKDIGDSPRLPRQIHHALGEYLQK